VNMRVWLGGVLIATMQHRMGSSRGITPPLTAVRSDCPVTGETHTYTESSDGSTFDGSSDGNLSVFVSRTLTSCHHQSPLFVASGCSHADLSTGPFQTEMSSMEHLERRAKKSPCRTSRHQGQKQRSLPPAQPEKVKPPPPLPAPPPWKTTSTTTGNGANTATDGVKPTVSAATEENDDENDDGEEEAAPKAGKGVNKPANSAGTAVGYFDDRAATRKAMKKRQESHQRPQHHHRRRQEAQNPNTHP
jgi:hypothetical protein